MLNEQPVDCLAQPGSRTLSCPLGLREFSLMTTAPSSIDALFVVVAASGTGKTSLVAALREQRPDLAVSVSRIPQDP